MAQFTVNATRFDPYKSFMFRVKWDGQYVAGLSKMSALKRTTDPVVHRDGGDPSHERKSPGKSKYDAVTLERGVTHDTDVRSLGQPRPLARQPDLAAELPQGHHRRRLQRGATRRCSRTSSSAAGSPSSRRCRPLDAGERGGGDRDDQARARGLGARRRRDRADRDLAGTLTAAAARLRCRAAPERRRARAGARAAPRGRGRASRKRCRSGRATGGCSRCTAPLTGRDVELTVTCGACEDDELGVAHARAPAGTGGIAWPAWAAAAGCASRPTPTCSGCRLTTRRPSELLRRCTVGTPSRRRDARGARARRRLARRGRS